MLHEWNFLWRQKALDARVAAPRVRCDGRWTVAPLGARLSAPALAPAPVRYDGR